MIEFHLTFQKTLFFMKIDLGEWSLTGEMDECGVDFAVHISRTFCYETLSYCPETETQTISCQTLSAVRE